MSSEKNHAPPRPLLIIISESDSLSAALRSKVRDVRRWRGDEPDRSFDGDPADPATYGWIREAPAVTAVIDLEPPERARGALEALRSVRQDAAIMLLSSGPTDVDGPA
ncbi:MAG TPA: hypothetical protein VHG09_05830, partial [Longimicrobiales bacterium]|nr:hypothetical protein [Longimicrobiales bacterium]